MLERCLQSVRAHRSDLLESQRVATRLGMPVMEMLEFEAEIAGRVCVTSTGQLLIADTRSSNPDIHMAAQTMRRTIAHALAQHLPPRQRIVMVGRFLEGRALDDLARELHVSVDEVGRLQSRALARLKRVPELQAMMRA